MLSAMLLSKFVRSSGDRLGVLRMVKGMHDWFVGSDPRDVVASDYGDVRVVISHFRKGGFQMSFYKDGNRYPYGPHAITSVILYPDDTVRLCFGLGSEATYEYALYMRRVTVFRSAGTYAEIEGNRVYSCSGGVISAFRVSPDGLLV